MRFRANLKSLMPLLTSTQIGADPTHPMVVKLQEYTRIPGPKKTAETHEQIARLQFEMNLPWEDDYGVVIPAINIKNALWDVAKEDKRGKQAERYINPVQPYFRLLYDGPTEKAQLIADKRFYRTELVNHGAKGKPAMVLHTRPMFEQWAVSTEWLVNEEKIEPREFQRWFETVGESTGIGAYRKLYGRFTVELKRLDDVVARDAVSENGRPSASILAALAEAR